MTEAFEEILKSWTIIEVTLKHVNKMLKGHTSEHDQNEVMFDADEDGY